MSLIPASQEEAGPTEVEQEGPYRLVFGPPGLEINPDTGELNWRNTRDIRDGDEYSVTVELTTPDGRKSQATYRQRFSRTELLKQTKEVSRQAIERLTRGYE